MNVYDPQVSEDQIWLDLQEASPLVPLDASTCFSFELLRSFEDIAFADARIFLLSFFRVQLKSR